jgi:hypothetical protein
MESLDFLQRKEDLSHLLLLDDEAEMDNLRISDNKVKGGSLKAFIILLSHHSINSPYSPRPPIVFFFFALSNSCRDLQIPLPLLDTEFNLKFLLTYYMFTDSHSLLQALKDRYPFFFFLC